MGLFERISKVMMNNGKTNHSLKNPEEALEKYIKDMEFAIVQLRRSMIYALAKKNSLENKYNYSLSEVIHWGQRVELALSAEDENLAKEALLRKNYHQENTIKLKAQIEFDTSDTVIKSHKQKLIVLEAQLIEAKTKQVMLKAGRNAAKAQRQLQETISGIDTNSAMGAFERMEDLEIKFQSATDLGGMGLEQKFVCFHPSDVDDELAVMKAQLLSDSINQGSLSAGDSFRSALKDSAIDAELEELRSQLND